MGRTALVVGLAGKACAGKDSLLPWFLKRGFTVIQADSLGHQAREAKRSQILERFGTDDRRALARIVFCDSQALADLEALTHPWIAAEILRLVDQANGPVVINAAILHRLVQAGLCDYVIWVEAPLFARLLRARARENRPWIDLIRRVWAQRKLRPQVFSQAVDILRVNNEGSLAQAWSALETRFDPVLVARLERGSP